MIKFETDKGIKGELRGGYLKFENAERMIGFECEVDELEEAIEELHDKFITA